MNINRFNSNLTLNFKGAALSVNTFSDSHGNLQKLDTFYEDFHEHKDELILEDKKGNQNAVIVAGDWFMSGNTRGYKSNKQATSCDYQIIFFNMLIKKLRHMTSNLASYFLTGNHELDGGEEEFIKLSKNIDAKILMSNLDFENSYALKEQIDKKKIVKSDILEIEDDKNPNLTHKALFIGISPVNMSYYKQGLKGIKFIESPFKAEKLVNEEDYKETFEDTVKTIEDFKNKNPKGLVIVSTHTGAGFAKKLAQTLGDDINIIFNAHEHKEQSKPDIINGVPVVELSQNFKKYVNAKFYIDDNGNLKGGPEIKSYRPKRKAETKNGGHETFFKRLFNKIFTDDLKPEYLISTPDPDIKSLDNEHVRTTNSYLANFITDSLLSAIQKTHPEVQIFSINASAIRGSLNTKNEGGANNLQMIELLGGITRDNAGILKNNVDGMTLLELIKDNLLFNKKAPERNPLMQYSGLIIDKKGLLDGIENGIPDEELLKYVKTSFDNKPLEADRTYVLANVEKQFKKSKNPLIKEKLYPEAEPLNLNARDIFGQYVEENKEYLFAKCDVRIFD